MGINSRDMIVLSSDFQSSVNFAQVTDGHTDIQKTMHKSQHISGLRNHTEYWTIPVPVVKIFIDHEA